MLPVDFSMANFDHVDKEALDTGRLVQTLDGTHSKLKLLMFDACRNNPLEDRGAKPLQQADEPQAAGGQHADHLCDGARHDGDRRAGDHSPFAEGIMTNIAQPDTELSDLIRQVTMFVRDKTQGRQSVWIDGTVDEHFYLGKYAGAAGSVAAFAPPEPRPAKGWCSRIRTRCRSPTPISPARTQPSCGLPATRSWRGAARSLPTRRWPSISQKFAWYQAADRRAEARAIEQQNLDLIRQYEMKVAAPSQGFIFPDSDRRLLTREEVAPLDKPQLRIARNEIYARRGRKFVIREVRDYFQQFDWYDPRFGEIELTYVEQKNVDLIRGFEK